MNDVTINNLKSKMTGILTALSTAMIAADQEQMRRLSKIGDQLGEEQRKLKQCSQLKNPMPSLIHSINHTLDSLFHKLIVMEALERLNKGEQCAKPVVLHI